MVQHSEVIEKAFKDKFDVCRQATYVAELEQNKRRFKELKVAEQRLLVKFTNPANNYSEEALQGALSEIKNKLATVRNRISELESTISSEEEQGRKMKDVQTILDTLKDKIPDATFDIKRQVCEQLIKEVRIVKTEDGLPLMNKVYWFDKELIEANSDMRLHSARMSVRNVITTFERELILA
jgi:hypothetical protein